MRAGPSNAGAAAVICAAFIIALAAMLLFYLLKPRKGPRTTSDDRAFDSAAVAAQPFFNSAAGAARQDNLRNNLAYQRFYVDHCYIRLADSGARNGRKVTLFQDDAVVYLVARNHEA